MDQLVIRIRNLENMLQQRDIRIQDLENQTAILVAELREFRRNQPPPAYVNCRQEDLFKNKLIF